MGAVEYAPGEAKGTPWHPHRGFETVTYIMDGAFEHHDSTGGGGLITDGATQWMTAGAGILHIEMPPEPLVVRRAACSTASSCGSTCPPRQVDAAALPGHRGGDVTLLSSPTAAPWSGSSPATIDGTRGARGHLHADHLPARDAVARARDCRCRGRPTSTPWCTCCPGEGWSAPRRRPLDEGQLAVFGAGRRRRDRRPRPPAGRRRIGWEVLVLGGLPIGEPVARYGPFVMNTRAEIFQALEDFQAGRMGRIPAEQVPHRTEADDPVTP